MGTKKKERKKNAVVFVVVVLFFFDLVSSSLGKVGRRRRRRRAVVVRWSLGGVVVLVAVWFGRGDGLVQRDLRQHEERGLRDQMRMLQSGDRGNWIPIRRDTRADDRQGHTTDANNLERRRRRDGQRREEEGKTREVSIEIRRTVRGETAGVAGSHVSTTTDCENELDARD